MTQMGLTNHESLTVWAPALAAESQQDGCVTRPQCAVAGPERKDRREASWTWAWPSADNQRGNAVPSPTTTRSARWPTPGRARPQSDAPRFGLSAPLSLFTVLLDLMSPDHLIPHVRTPSLSLLFSHLPPPWRPSCCPLVSVSFLLGIPRYSLTFPPSHRGSSHPEGPCVQNLAFVL